LFSDILELLTRGLLKIRHVPIPKIKDIPQGNLRPFEGLDAEGVSHGEDHHDVTSDNVEFPTILTCAYSI
jgi:hypothetical protein